MSRSATNVHVVLPQIANYHAYLHSVGTTRMWAHAQTLPPHCEGSGSETIYLASYKLHLQRFISVQNRF